MTEANLRPRIGITLGDPAGIGPEVLVKALPEVIERCQPVLFGCRWTLEEAANSCGVDIYEMAGWELDETEIERPSDFVFGRVSAVCGRIGVESFERAVHAALAGKIDAIMTCPLNKAAIHEAGYEDIGHQEILGRICQSQSTATMLMTPGLRVVHLSTHKSLIEAAQFVTKETVLERLQLCATSFERWGLPKVRIGVAALNPHGGEEGLLGREEIEQIAPAVAAGQQDGIDVAGPYPADSIFNRAIGGEFDVLLAMYHDQGHIAIKVHNFHDSISATLGIPFVRTSVDHGTAFDIAGKGIANPQGTVAAIDAAITLATGQLQ